MRNVGVVDRWEPLATHMTRITRRERDLLKAIVEGLPNREIAERFGISEQTVRNGLSVLYQKFDVRSRLQLAVKAVKEKLVV